MFGLLAILVDLVMEGRRIVSGLIRESRPPQPLIYYLIFVKLSVGRCDSYDVGTFPNRTLKNYSCPAAALHLDASKEKYNF